MPLHPEERDHAPWTPVPPADVVRALGAAASVTGRPLLVGVDGRSAGGKTTTAALLAASVPDGHVVHTDDIAWWHSFFDWSDLMVTGVLEPLRAGLPVRYRPPPWDERGRPGAVEVPAGSALVVVEGVGAGRRELAPLLDAVVWVQGDDLVRQQREDARAAAGHSTSAFQREWAEQEDRFVVDRRPWEAADLVVLGTPSQDPGPGRLLVSDLSAARRGG